MKLRDHPRLRGKDGQRNRCGGTGRGSPPLARERHEQGQQCSKDKRITPACAGKTRNRHQEYRECEDHPRLRGKDHGGMSSLSRASGSPPLARERHVTAMQMICWCRITPACAGKTNWPDSSMSRMRDHPRLRGKDLPAGRCSEYRWGSPPLARERRKKST